MLGNGLPMHTLLIHYQPLSPVLQAAPRFAVCHEQRSQPDRASQSLDNFIPGAPNNRSGEAHCLGKMSQRLGWLPGIDQPFGGKDVQPGID